LCDVADRVAREGGWPGDTQPGWTETPQQPTESSW
jgi:hypothetical protein